MRVIKLASDDWMDKYMKLSRDNKKGFIKFVTDFMDAHPDACSNLQLVTYNNDLSRCEQYEFDYNDPLSNIPDTMDIDLKEDAIVIPEATKSVYLLGVMDSKFELHLIVFFLALSQDSHYPGNIMDHCNEYEYDYEHGRIPCDNKNMDNYCTMCHGMIYDNNEMGTACRRYNEDIHMTTSNFLWRAHSFVDIDLYLNYQPAIFPNDHDYATIFLESYAENKSRELLLDNQMRQYISTKKLDYNKMSLGTTAGLTRIFQNIVDKKKLADIESKRVDDERKLIDDERKQDEDERKLIENESKRVEDERKRMEDEQRKKEECLKIEEDIAKSVEMERKLLQEIEQLQKTRATQFKILASNK